MTQTLPAPADTTPPADLAPPRPANPYAAEQIVLGAMMINPHVVEEIEALLTAADFLHPQHPKIFTAIVELRADGKPTDPTAVARHLGHRDLALIGGGPYLHTLTEVVPLVASATYHAQRVADLAKFQRIAQFAARTTQLSDTAPGTGLTPDDTVEKIREHLTDLDAITAGHGPTLWADIIGPGLTAIEEAGEHDGPRGLSTGLYDLDQLINGLQNGQLIVVAGRPGSGKSLLGSDVCRHIALKHRLPAAYLSLEMGRLELFNRIVSAHTAINHDKIISGKLTDDEWLRIARACGDTETAPLYIDDTPGLSLADIRTRVRRLKRQHGLRLLVVDYLQLIQAPKGIDNRQEQVAAMSRGLKLLAKEENIPVILMAQINRESEKRSDKRPQMSDLRESGAVEQDADVIILIHREEQSDKKTVRRGEADFIVAKNRNGATATVVVAAQLHIQSFASMAFL